MARTRRSPSSRRDIRTLAGHVGLVESQAAGWGGDSGSARPNRDWTPSRIAAAPPDGMLRAAEMVTVEVMAACGVPHSLFAPGQEGRGSAKVTGA